MKNDFWTGVIDFTGIGSDFGYGAGTGFDYEPYLSGSILNMAVRGKAHGDCDRFGNMYLD